MQDYSKPIGKVLRQLRERAGYTQADIAQKMGMSYQMIQKYEAGRSGITVDRLTDFANIYRMSLQHLVRLIIEAKVDRDNKEKMF